MYSRLCLFLFLAILAAECPRLMAQHSDRISKAADNLAKISNAPAIVLYKETQVGYLKHEQAYHAAIGNKVRVLEVAPSAALYDTREVRRLSKLAKLGKGHSVSTMLVETVGNDLVIRSFETVGCNGDLTRTVAYPSNYLADEWSSEKGFKATSDSTDVGRTRFFPDIFRPSGIYQAATFLSLPENADAAKAVEEWLKEADLIVLPDSPSRLLLVGRGKTVTTVEWDGVPLLPRKSSARASDGRTEAECAVEYKKVDLNGQEVWFPSLIRSTTFATVEGKRLPLLEKRYELVEIVENRIQNADQLVETPAELTPAEIEASSILKR